MMGNRFSWALVFIGITLLLLGVIASNAFILKWEETGGYYSNNKVVISSKNIKDAKDDTSAFSQDDIKRLKIVLNTENMTYEAHCNKYISGGLKTVSANLCGVNYKYQNFENISMKYGSFFIGNEDNESCRDVVIYDDMAFKLFGNDDVAGLNIKIAGREFRISGVAARESSILNAVPDNLKPDVLMIEAEMLGIDDDTGINVLQIAAESTNTDGKNIRDIEAALKSIGKDGDDYNIEDYTIKRLEMMYRPSGVIGIVCTICILIAIWYIWKIIKRLYMFTVEEMKKYYFVELVKLFFKKHGVDILKITFLLSGIYILCKKMAFPIYIAPEYIPDNIIDFSFYGELIKKEILNSLSGIGYCNSVTVFRTYGMMALLNILFTCAVFLGIPLMITGLCRLKKSTVLLYDVVKVSAIMFLVSAVMLTFACVMAGLPVRIDWIGMMAIFLCMILIYVYLILKKFEINSKEYIV